MEERMIALYKYRCEANLTQKQLALQLGVTAGCVGMWETGNRKPDIITLKKIAHILNCTVDELLEPIEI